MKISFFGLLLLMISFNSFAQQHEVVVEGEARHYENGHFVCRQDERYTTMKNAWIEAKLNAEEECKSDVQLREKYDEYIKCGDFGTSIYASVKARFACVPTYDSCEIPSPYCENNCCD